MNYYTETELKFIFENSMLLIETELEEDYGIQKMKKQFEENRLNDKFYNKVKIFISETDDLCRDIYDFCHHNLKLNNDEIYEIIKDIIYKCQTSYTKDIYYHFMNNKKVNSQYKKIFKNNNFKSYYVEYLNTESKPTIH